MLTMERVRTLAELNEFLKLEGERWGRAVKAAKIEPPTQ